ncbi:MAG: hypothetical protein IT168_05735 [Bryobacterales bacterium]|nr:hypothetical protein [Bryobacterales bacterium]
MRPSRTFFYDLRSPNPPPKKAPRPTLPLADVIRIQRFAKRTPPPRTSPETEPQPSGRGPNLSSDSQGSTAQSDDLLKHFPPSVATEIRQDADALDVTVNFLVSQYAKIGHKTAQEECMRNEPNLDLSENTREPKRS